MPRVFTVLQLHMNGFIQLFLEMSFGRRFGKEVGRGDQGPETFRWFRLESFCQEKFYDGFWVPKHVGFSD